MISLKYLHKKISCLVCIIEVQGTVCVCVCVCVLAFACACACACVCVFAIRVTVVLFKWTGCPLSQEGCGLTDV